MFEEKDSKYCYEGTNILKNKLNIKNEKILNDIERKITTIRLIDIDESDKIDIKNENVLNQIHKHLFGDIYYFAGEYRTENIAKDNFRFAEYEYIPDEMKRIMKELREENYLENMGKEILAKRLAYYMSEFNVLHPYREGNGRTIREFIRRLALHNGYNLKWRKKKAEEILEVSKESIVNVKPLENLLYNCLDNH